MLTPLKDSGSQEKMATGSQRDNRAGKGRYDLLPPKALRAVARHFEAGAVKYGARNWELGQPLGRVLDSAIRHLFEVLDGDLSEDHAAAAVWNILVFMETRERIKAGLLPAELDDLPSNPTCLRCTGEEHVVGELRDQRRTRQGLKGLVADDLGSLLPDKTSRQGGGC